MSNEQIEKWDHECFFGRRAAQECDFATALLELKPLANQSNPLAQLTLGKMHLRGDGVPKDFVLAYKWFNLAATQGIEQAKKHQTNLKTLMTNAQITKAQKLASEFVPTDEDGNEIK